MIIDSFDNKSKPLISPDSFYKKENFKEDVCIGVFSKYALEYALSKYKHEVAFSYECTGGKMPVYRIFVDNKSYLLYQSLIGGPAAVTLLTEINYIAGVKKFVIFGSSGGLIDDVQGKVIVPTSAYRDEGVSYHYMSPSDYIDVKNHNVIENILKDNNVPYIKGKTWTTDAIYMETVNKVNERKNDGCISVEMECASLQAVANYINVDLYTFFFTGDLLLDKWEKNNMGGENERKEQVNMFDIALMIAKRA